MKKESLDNLIEWKPGQSGNPKGRPKGALSRKTIIKRFLSCNSGVNDNDGKELTVAETIWMQQIRKALLGDKDAVRLLSDYHEGKATDNKKVDLNAKLSDMTREEKEKMFKDMIGM